MPHKPHEHVGPRLPRGTAVLGGEVRGEMLDEPGDVIPTGPERGHNEMHGREPIEEILAEAAPLDLDGEVAVGRGDHLHVDRNRLGRADRGHFPSLEHLEQLRLDLERHLTDLIEKQHTAVGGAEAAERRADGPGERALLVAEELAFGDGGDQAAAVHRHERLRPPRTGRVDPAGDLLLAAAGLPGDEHRALEPGDAVDGMLELSDRVRHALEPRP